MLHMGTEEKEDGKGEEMLFLKQQHQLFMIFCDLMSWLDFITPPPRERERA